MLCIESSQMAVYNLLAAAVLSAQRINEMLKFTQEHPFSMDESGDSPYALVYYESIYW